jgi:hypothetical protein
VALGCNFGGFVSFLAGLFGFFILLLRWRAAMRLWRPRRQHNKLWEPKAKEGARIRIHLNLLHVGIRDNTKLPAQNVGARHTALHSLPQPPITKVYFESRSFSASCPRRRETSMYIYIYKLNRCQECWVWNHHLIMIHPRTDTVCKRDASSTFVLTGIS